MSDMVSTEPKRVQSRAPIALGGLNWQRAGILYARIALGAAFLSAVADRFGLWGKYGGWGNFATFTKYVAQVNSFMPAFTIPFLAWAWICNCPCA